MKSNNVIVKNSKIDGMGVFANREFKKGEVVIKWNTDTILTDEDVKNLPEEEKRYLTAFKDKYILQQSPAKFVNHSCEPNTKVVDESSDIAIKDIKKGKEITSYYLSFFCTDETIKCNCKSKKCKNK